MTDKLKPCPFCGGTDVGWDSRGEYYGQYAFFGCHNCGAGFCDADECDRFHPIDVEAWNRRADLPPTIAQALALPEIAALVAALICRDGGTHDDDCKALRYPHLSPEPCNCGHDVAIAALAKVQP